MTVEEAKLFLEEQGYYTKLLWQIYDVKSIFPGFDDETCQKVLHDAFDGEYMTNSIFEQIEYEGQKYKKE